MKKLSIICIAILTCTKIMCTGTFTQLKTYGREFLHGTTAGVLSAVVVNHARDHILPDMTQYKLYDNYGVCRDQLAGGVKVATGAFGIVYYNQDKQTDKPDTKAYAARMTGILAGMNITAVLTKIYSIIKSKP